MKYNLILRPEAKEDLGDSFQWYQEIYKNVRRVLTRRFPYGICYIIEGTTSLFLLFFMSKEILNFLKSEGLNRDASDKRDDQDILIGKMLGMRYNLSFLI